MNKWNQIKQATCFGIVLVGLVGLFGCNDGKTVARGVARATVPDPEISITMNSSLWYGSWMQLHNRSNSRMVANLSATSADGKKSKTVSFGIPPNGTADADINNFWAFESGDSGSISVDGFSKKLYFRIDGKQYWTWFDF